MDNNEKRLLLINAGKALEAVQWGSHDHKLTLKLEARDAIEYAVEGTVAQSITEWLQNHIAPHCEPFSNLHFLRMASLAGAVAEGKSGLVRAYGAQILETDIGL
jgi:hypothetical protein